MIYDFLVIDCTSQACIYHYRNPESKFQLGTNLAAKLAVSISNVSSILSPDKSEKIQSLITTSLKMSFEKVENYVFLLVASSDHDDLELNYLVTELTNSALNMIKQGTIRFLDINEFIYKGEIRRSKIGALTKTMMLRFGNLLNQIKLLNIEIDVLKETKRYDPTEIIMLTTLESQLEEALLQLKTKIKEMPSMQA